MTATFRFVKKVYSTSRTTSGHASWTCNHSEFVADRDGDWVEKDYGNGSRAYMMAADCNARAIAKMRNQRELV